MSAVDELLDLFAVGGHEEYGEAVTIEDHMFLTAHRRWEEQLLEHNRSHVHASDIWRSFVMAAGGSPSSSVVSRPVFCPPPPLWLNPKWPP